MHAKLHLLRLEVGNHPADDLQGEDLGQNGARDQHRGHHRDYDGECLLRIRFALLG